MDDQTFYDIAHNRVQDKIIPRFFKKWVKDEYQSAQQGRTIEKQLEYVEMYIPGDTRTVPIRPVQEKDKARWPGQYLKFTAGEVMVPDGTPLAKWPPMDQAQAQEFAEHRVFTVEQLAGVSDTHLSSMPLGARKLRDQAVFWLAQARDNSGISQLMQKNEELTAQMQAQNDRIGDLMKALERERGERPAFEMAPPVAGVDQAMLAKMVADAVAAAQPPKSKPGRKPREATAAAGEDA